jgi:hypothetical protein
MSYTRNVSKREAVQWDGTNAEEVIAKADAWLSCWPGQHATHDVENGVIITCNNYQISLGDWLVSAGNWGLVEAGQDGDPEILQDSVFQVKYAQQA